MSETQTTPAATANTNAAAPAAAPADAPTPMVIPTKKGSSGGSASFAGDNILPGATVVYDQKKTIYAPAEDVWPWLVQWGKGRGGWYVPSKIEKALPEKYRSAPTIDPKWQALRVGDTVPDYGFIKKSKKGGEAVEYQLEVALIENQRALVYKGHRLGQDFTWALLLENRNGSPAGANGSSAASTASAPECVLHLRFRGLSDQTGWKAKVTEVVGKAADAAMAAAMFPGIADRAEQQVKVTSQPAQAST